MSTHTLNGLPPDSVVLVTGANGYLGSQIVDELLRLGHRVRGTVRAPKSWLDAFFTERHGKERYESVVINDLRNREEMIRIIQGVQGVVHVASDLSLRTDPEVVIPPVIHAIENLLEAAAATSVQRFVLTSSPAAVLTPVPNVPVRVDENTWNEAQVRAAWDPNAPAETRGYSVYSASKTQGEQAAWKWMEGNKPAFIFNAVLPDRVLGPVLHPNIGGSTMRMVRRMADGDKTVPNVWFPKHFVDIIDTAQLHAIALLSQHVQSKRIFAFAEPYNLSRLLAVLHRLCPEATLPDASLRDGQDMTKVVPAKIAEDLLKEYYGHGWTSFEMSVEEGLKTV